MNKVTYAIAGAATLVVLGVAGFTVANAVTAPAPVPTSSVSATDPSVAPMDSSTVTDPTATPTATTNPVDTKIAPDSITGPGQECDMHTLYTEPCSIDYPTTGFLNAMIRGLQGMGSLSNAQMLAYGHAACDAMTAGASPASVSVVPVENASPAGWPVNWNNSVVVGAAKSNLCREFKDL